MLTASRYQPLTNTPLLLEAHPIVDPAGQPVKPDHSGGGSGPLTRAEVKKFKRYCQLIGDKRQLQAILQQVADPDERGNIFSQIRPWLSFPCTWEELEFS